MSNSPHQADHAYGFGTRAIHAGAQPDPVTGARATPIHQTTSFVFDSAEHASSLFNLQTFGNVYSRISNPTVAVFEERIASLENGRAALACASGMAAQMAALLAILKTGDHIVAASTLYGGTVGQLGVGFARLGIETTFVDPADPENFARAMRPNTRAVYGETIGNPLVNVLLGMLLLGERLRRLQWVAVGLAALGVAQQLAGVFEVHFRRGLGPDVTELEGADSGGQGIVAGFGGLLGSIGPCIIETGPQRPLVQRGAGGRGNQEQARHLALAALDAVFEAVLVDGGEPVGGADKLHHGLLFTGAGLEPGFVADFEEHLAA